ncbi:uncharacterized protein SPAPADRAFT_54312 [Spathaspora passalidarum NRRL Y-27907]|uniref:Spindle pole body component n=1 Tax=Spathaspora passalidarum (strain NRRL Y-27907 / 11-Y1) TaxID=619300 RepID=G3AHF8_SPAPN|nr:uncharacterized protein SPAPADRAFT_54312 [Spathaspora passalidarum NRRL Y-27907]EGW34122.1 hypothetical protein SPAPADRAFT_54312 [Spathaspora passalidarum NRRL Y-27907]
MISFISSHGGGNVPPDVVTLSDSFEDIQPHSNNNNIIQSHLKPTKIKAPLVSQITDLHIQQGLIVRDLLFALLGYEGIFIKYAERYDPQSLECRILGPEFKIAKNLDLSLKTVTKKLRKLGRYYSGLTEFIQYYDSARYGKVVQRFCYVVNEFLIHYKSVILELEHEFQYNASFNLTKLDQVLSQEVANKLLHLYEIAVEIHLISEERRKHSHTDEYTHQALSELIPKSNFESSARIETNLYLKKFDCCKGGLVLQLIQQRLRFYKGEAASFAFLTKLLDTVAEDYLVMLNTWLTEGKIDDPFDEFLIREKEVPPTFIDIFDSKSEYYWNELFLIKTDGLLEQFQNYQIQSKILTTGKYLNIFKQCTGISDFSNLHEKLQTISTLSSQDLELKIDEFYKRANKMFMKLLFQGYNLRQLVTNYQTKYFFENSYKIDKFIDGSFSELKRDKFKVSISRLQKQYYDLYNSNEKIHKIGTIPSISDIIQERQSFTISNESLYQVANELMEGKPDFEIQQDQDLETNIRLISNTLHREGSNSPQSTRGDTTAGGGGRRFSPSKQTKDPDDNIAIASVHLSIDLPFPLNLVINRELSYHYEIIFKLLMNLKFISRYNDIIAKEINQSDVWRYPNFEPRILKWILRIRSLHSRVRLFMDELQSYINYDVIESHYAEIRTLLQDTEVELAETELGSDIGQEQEGQLFNNNTVLQGTGNSNSIFENRILDALQRPGTANKRNGRKAHELLSVDNLVLQLREYLNTVITESLLTKYELLYELKRILDFMMQFNHYIVLYKKILIVSDRNLHEVYSEKFPERFKDKVMDPNSIDRRFANLNNSLMEQHGRFSEYLASFLDKIRKYGVSENGGLLALSDRLEQCFPE